MSSVVFVLFGYLLGSVPFGLLLTRAAGLGDIRKVGSGNIGATNVLRTGRRGLAATTLLLDGLKGALAVLIAAYIVRQDPSVWTAPGGPLAAESVARDAALWAGFGAVFGHMFPLWLGFRGGKGVATGFGVLIAAAWPVGLLAGACWLIVAKVAKMSSLASLIAFVLAPVLAWLLSDIGLVKLSFAIAVLVYVRHHANIRRLLAGTEPRIGQGGAHTA